MSPERGVLKPVPVKSYTDRDEPNSMAIVADPIAKEVQFNRLFGRAADVNDFHSRKPFSLDGRTTSFVKTARSDNRMSTLRMKS